MSIKDKIVYYAYKYEGDWSKISLAIKSNEEVKQIKYKDNFITFFDDLYPIELRKLRFPPWVIFYKGDISLLNRKCISIVGSRNACSYGIDITKKIVLQNKDKVIVSGLAKGIDAMVKAWDNYIHATENAVKASKERQDGYRDEAQTLSTKKSSLQEIAKEYDNLNNKSDKTAEDLTRLNELKQQKIKIYYKYELCILFTQFYV